MEHQGKFEAAGLVGLSDVVNDITHHRHVYPVVEREALRVKSLHQRHKEVL